MACAYECAAVWGSNKGDEVGFTRGIFDNFANILYSNVFQKAFYNSDKYDKGRVRTLYNICLFSHRNFKLNHNFPNTQ